MAWPRSKNSRSSAQPGTHPHDGVQATVTPAPDAEPFPGTGQNTGVGGTRHAVAADPPRGSRRLRPIRYAHSVSDDATAVPAETVGRPPDAAIPDPAEAGTELPGTVLSGRVLRGPAPAGETPEAYEDVGLVYEAPRPAYSEPLGPEPSAAPG